MINPGEKISHYVIVSALGSGGMGEVYLAKDTKLERRVAIKFLHREFSGQDDTLRRFVREAKAASSLNHPGIITIHEIGEWDGASFISMEFVEGQSLRELINGRKLSFENVLDIIFQTASALAAAHEAGIVHRDIKPENIMYRPDNLVKVLDFGLAKQLNTSVDVDGINNEVTTKGLVDTAPGFVIGTAAYMSPEQARGKPTDARTDIWSLGVVLYEMISGRVPFPGETKNDMLAGILRADPLPLSTTASGITHEFEHIIKKALGKNCDDRYQVIRDLILDLKILKSELKTIDSEAYPSPGPKTNQISIDTQDGNPYQTTSDYVKRGWLWGVIPVAILLTVGALWYAWQRSQQPESTILQSLASIQITSWKSELGEGVESHPRLSPDGKLIAYVASKGGNSAIWLKQIDGGEPFTRKQDDHADSSPLWSPDGGQIAFFSERGGRRGIWAAPALGGDSTMLAPLDAQADLIHWARDGSTIFFKMGPNLYTLNLQSREISKLTGFEEAFEHDFSVSPDEKRIAYIDKANEQTDIWLSGLRGENPVRLTDDAADDRTPIWHPDGKRIIYNSNRGGIIQICVVFLDGNRQAQLSLSDTDSHVADISRDGTKILYTTAKDDADLWGVSTDGGKELQITSDIGVEFWPDISPDGSAIVYQAVRRLSTGGKLLHCLLMTQGLKREGRISQLAPDAFYPLWSPDGANIAFLRSQSGNNALWVTSSAGGGERAVSEGGIMFAGYSMLPYNRVQTLDYQWSPDGRSLIYTAIRAGVSNIWQTFADGTGEKQLTANTDKKLLFFNPVFAPDGKNIAWSVMTTEAGDKRTWGIWMLSNGAARQLYQSNSVMRLIGWSQSGGQVIVKSVESKTDAIVLPNDFAVSEIDTNDNSRRPVAALKNSYFQNVTLSPDRKTLAFVTRLTSGDAIQTLTVSKPLPRTVLRSNDSRVYFSNLVFAPDGKTLYYGKQSNSQVISMINNFK